MKGGVPCQGLRVTSCPSKVEGQGSHLGGALELLAGEGVKLADTVHAVRGAQCRVVATPLVRDYVDQHRPGRFGGLHICER